MQPRGLLEGRGYRSGRRGGFGDGIVDSIPDERIIRIIGEGCLQERLDAVEVEVVRTDTRVQFEEIVAKGAMACFDRRKRMVDVLLY